MADTTANYYPTYTRVASTIDPFDFSATFAPALLTTDTTSPTVTLLSPTTGAVGKTTPVVVRVYDDLALGAHAITVEYLDIYGLYEVAWDGELLPGGQLSSTTRGAYDVSRVLFPSSGTHSAGWDYTILRRRGWLANPTIRVRAADTRGNTV